MGTLDTTIEGRALAAVKVLSDLGAVRAAYLFGSHVEGTPDQWSDIDVTVFMEGVEHWDIHQRATAHRTARTSPASAQSIWLPVTYEDGL